MVSPVAAGRRRSAITKRARTRSAVAREGVRVGGHGDAQGVGVGAVPLQGIACQLPLPGVEEPRRPHLERREQAAVVGHEQLGGQDLAGAGVGEAHGHGQGVAPADGGVGQGDEETLRHRGSGGGHLENGEVGGVVAGVGAGRVPGQAVAGRRSGRGGALAGVEGPGVAELQGVHDLVVRVPQLHRVRTVLPVHGAGEIPDHRQPGVGLAGGHDQDAVGGDRGAAEIDGAIGLPVAAVDPDEGPAVQRRARRAGQLGEDIDDVGAGAVVEDLLDPHLGGRGSGGEDRGGHRRGDDHTGRSRRAAGPAVRWPPPLRRPLAAGTAAGPSAGVDEVEMGARHGTSSWPRRWWRPGRSRGRASLRGFRWGRRQPAGGSGDRLPKGAGASRYPGRWAGWRG